MQKADREQDPRIREGHESRWTRPRTDGYLDALSAGSKTSCVPNAWRSGALKSRGGRRGGRREGAPRRSPGRRRQGRAQAARPAPSPRSRPISGTIMRAARPREGLRPRRARFGRGHAAFLAEQRAGAAPPTGAVSLAEVRTRHVAELTFSTSLARRHPWRRAPRSTSSARTCSNC